MRRDDGYERGSIDFSTSPDVSGPVTVALIFRQPPRLMSFGSLGFTFICATVVSISKHEEGVFFARMEDTGYLYLAREGYMLREHFPYASGLKDKLISLYESPALEERSVDMGSILLSGQRRVFDGQWLPRDQQWCVD